MGGSGVSDDTGNSEARLTAHSGWTTSDDDGLRMGDGDFRWGRQDLADDAGRAEAVRIYLLFRKYNIYV